VDDATLGALETGGTTCVCAVGTGPSDIRAQERFPTTTPGEVLERVTRFFREAGPIAALGIGAFGPVDLHASSPTWGHVTTTPKPGWAHTPLAPALRDALGVPVAFETDVTASALGEHRWGAGQGADPLVYVTIGTGIGAGVLVDGRPVHGLLHPELGHLRIPHDRARDPFEGVCPYHGDCLEGLASGAALGARPGPDPAGLPIDHPVWRLEAEYVALGLVSVIAVLSPQRVVVGGGVGTQPGFLPRVAAEVDRLLAGYLEAPAIVPPALGGRQGILGALAMASRVAAAV
jgi:fructokinase